MPKIENSKIFLLLPLYASDLLSSPLFQREQNFMQHGNSTVYKHSISVAVVALLIARRLKLKVNEREMTRGALLHDYFLYDWHEKHPFHRWHGFNHAKKALLNAQRDFGLTKLEEHIIERHMFPLNIKPPFKKEGIIVCIADKLCALRETFKKR